MPQPEINPWRYCHQDRNRTQIRPVLFLYFLNHHCCAVCEHLGNPATHLRCVVAYTNDCIRSHLSRMFRHELVCMISRFFCERGKECDVAAYECLQSTADGAEYRAGAHNYPLRHSLVLDNFVPRQFKRGRHHVIGYFHTVIIAKRQNGTGRVFTRPLSLFFPLGNEQECTDNP